MPFPDYQDLSCQLRKQLSAYAEKLLGLVFPFPKDDYKPLEGPITLPSIIPIRPCASQCLSDRATEEQKWYFAQILSLKNSGH